MIQQTVAFHKGAPRIANRVAESAWK